MLSIKGWPVTPSRTVRVDDGGSVCVRELPGPSGAPAVLLLHGLGATAGLQYTPLLHQMAEHYRVLALDMRRPRSTVDGSRLFASVSADAVAALDDAGIDRAVVLGYSIGGLVARVLANNHPDRVQGLVLAATFDAPRSGPWRRPLDVVARAAGALPGVPLPSRGELAAARLAARRDGQAVAAGDARRGARRPLRTASCP